jgi:pyrimidine-specific ribonucleoside hydrolase
VFYFVVGVFCAFRERRFLPGPMTNIATLIQNHPIIIPLNREISTSTRDSRPSRSGKLNVFDYNYEFDYKSMQM